jgi:isopropylmalate/homocitrate/citramalate synthase
MSNKFKLMKGKETTSFELRDIREPELYREQFPYSEVPRILFDGNHIVPEPAEEIWITDTSFRDGQQARPPYSVKQIVDLFTFLHRLGGRKGLVRQSEFFLYSRKDQQAVEKCLELGYKFPEVTGWIRANADDFKLVKQFGLKETGILTSVSDYHIFLKLKKNRKKAMEDYLAIVDTAMQEGIIPRCHFEDVTRADIYGFCLPFAEELMKLSEKTGIPVKIRLCDTMGYGVTYPGALLPRSVPKLAAAFHKDLGFPSQLLEWHGHNDFHKVHINGSTAWLYGISGLNASLLGYGERTGNPPLEAAVIEYISLTGADKEVNTKVISEIADYFRDEVHADVPKNYPFVGEEFNTTRAGIHADGLLKNQEIYNIFDTDKLLNRPIMVNVTDKSGVAGIAHWLNQYAQRLSHVHVEPISKRHPGVKRIYEWVDEQYENGRTTAISPDEMIAQAKRHLPQMFESDFPKVKKQVREKADIIARKISDAPPLHGRDEDTMEKFLKDVMREEPFINFLAIANLEGELISHVHAQRGEKGQFRQLRKENFEDHFWFKAVKENGKPFFSDVYDSRFTGALIITAAYPLLNDAGKMIGVVDIDFKFEEMYKLLNDLPEDIMEAEKEKILGQKK